MLLMILLPEARSWTDLPQAPCLSENKVSTSGVQSSRVVRSFQGSKGFFLFNLISLYITHSIFPVSSLDHVPLSLIFFFCEAWRHGHSLMVVPQDCPSHPHYAKCWGRKGETDMVLPSLSLQNKWIFGH